MLAVTSRKRLTGRQSRNMTFCLCRPPPTSAVIVEPLPDRTGKLQHFPKETRPDGQWNVWQHQHPSSHTIKWNGLLKAASHCSWICITHPLPNAGKQWYTLTIPVVHWPYVMSQLVVAEWSGIPRHREL